MSEGRIVAEGDTIIMEPVHGATGITMGWKMAECQDDATATEIARRCEAFKVVLPERDALVKALTWALPFARAAWMQALNNAPQGTAAYARWAAMPEWIKLDEGLENAEAALKVTEVAA